MNVINVGELDEQVSRLLNEKKATKKRGGIYIDLRQLCYDKLLGRGKATRPLIIEVPSYSRSATEKIMKAEGKILKHKNQKSCKRETDISRDLTPLERQVYNL